MASVGNLLLVNETALATNKTSDAKTLQQGSGKFIAHLRMNNETGTVALGGKIEHSADGVYWHTLHTFTGLSANGAEIGQISINVLPNIRADLTLAGGTADVFCALWFDPRA